MPWQRYRLEIEHRSKYSLNKLSIHISAFVFAFVICGSTSANSITFAQFVDAGSQNIALINNSDGSQTLSANAVVQFSYSNVLNLPNGLTGVIPATLSLLATSTQNVGMTTIAGSQYAYIGGFAGSFHFTANGGGYNGHTDLLTGFFNNHSILLGLQGGQSATFSDSTRSGFPSEVVLTSDIVSLAPKEENFALSLSSIFDTQEGDAGFNVGGPSNTNVDNFVSSGTGTFASDPAPIFVAENQPIGLIIAGLFALLFVTSKTKPILP